ncbi:hypothetical protein BYT27DRAFT_7077700 [Phlegmacium glaucopus]|nr:hypothetical protein BYT27DRAFT_7077700 [Phlegmacium glaucopus]
MSGLFKFRCTFHAQGCSQRFRSQAGRTNHVRTFHTNHNIIESKSKPIVPNDGPFLPDDNQLLFHSNEITDLDFQSRSPSPIPDTPIQVDSSSAPKPTRNYHPHLSGLPCDAQGIYLLPGDPPEPKTANTWDWDPFDDEVQFRMGDFLYRKAGMSAGNIDELMDIWASSRAEDDESSPFTSHEHMYATIDAIPHGDAPWTSFTASFVGDIQSNAPSWQTADYEVWYRDPSTVIKNMLANPDFHPEFDYAPFVELDNAGERRWNEFMSGNFCWRHADTIYEADEETEGAMYCPIILGADKTTVSVATGHVEYHPLYLSIGNIHNTVRRAHRNAVLPIAFLAIPKSERKHNNDASFRKFKRQLYHTSLSTILKSLLPGMTTPVILRCPDGHYRRVIYDLAAFIADYPEQVYLAGTVQGWCPRCTALPDDLDGECGRRTREFTEDLLDTLDSKTLWDEYGIDSDVRPFTYDFPRADIHEILTPDLLHQLIKGTFKDHLVTWVGDYLALEHGEARADLILDDIDRRIAAMPLFPHLRRFPHGRRFKQWTGDDSKALMKVYVSAICGHVPDEMTMAISAFVDVCYLARRSDISESTLKTFNDALAKFYTYREIFKTTGVRPNGFSLPRQHSLSHYRHLIQEFGAPNGVCSSITESRHITAVKKPWRRSNRYEALGQMLLTNQRLDKLMAAAVDFVDRGMLPPASLHPQEALNIATHQSDKRQAGDDGNESNDESVVDLPRVEMVQGNVVLARTRIRNYPRDLAGLAFHLNQPHLPELTHRFLFEQLNPNTSAEDVLIDDYPSINSKISVYHSAVASFFAPSDECGLRGMRRERIRACPLWRKKAPRHDCAFVIENEDKPGMKGMSIVRVQLFFSFHHEGSYYPCALVEWYSTRGRSRDPVSGMWKVCPDIRQHERLCSVIHLDTFLRGAHLLPVFGNQFLPVNFHYTHSLDAFSAYYVNQFADHHMHEVVF